VDAAAGKLFVVLRQRNHIQHDVNSGHGKIVQHADVGHFDLRFPDFLALRRDFERNHIVTAETGGFVAEGDHVAGHRIHFRVGGESLADELAVKGIGRYDGFQRQQVHGRRRAVFFQRQQEVLVVDDMGIGGAAAEAPDARIILRRIAVHREQQPAGLVLRQPAFVTDITGLVMHVTVLDPEHADMTFAVERNIALRSGNCGSGPTR